MYLLLLLAESFPVKHTENRLMIASMEITDGSKRRFGRGGGGGGVTVERRPLSRRKTKGKSIDRSINHYDCFIILDLFRLKRSEKARSG